MAGDDKPRTRPKGPADGEPVSLDNEGRTATSGSERGKARREREATQGADVAMIRRKRLRSGQ